jgi:hypothetical protein
MSTARPPDERFRTIETSSPLALPRPVTGSSACCPAVSVMKTSSRVLDLLQHQVERECAHQFGHVAADNGDASRGGHACQRVLPDHGCLERAAASQ